ncbi:MAG TPA: HAD family hydrolase [Polyangiales bacterium]|nr:HAD family hydrolase [Polyangiales bacterium]
MGAKLLLFDIDGTLVRGFGSGGRALRRAAEALLGPSVREHYVNFGGALDPWLFRQLAQCIGRELDDELHGALRTHYAQLLIEELSLAAPAAIALPGVHSVLEQLRADRRVTLGLLTGNYAETGALKLRGVGIEPDWFPVQAWGDMAPTRPGLVPVALAQLATAVPAAEVVVIGDTLRDVECARENGCLCVAVATGGTSLADLRAAGAHVVVEDLSDPGPLLELLA